MNHFVSKIWHSTAARNVGKLLSANIIAQAIGLLVYPILTRLYSPEDFGVLNLFSSIAGVLILISTLEWYNAIVLPKEEREGRALVHLSLVCIAIVTLLIALTIPWAGPIAEIFHSPDLARYYWLLPIYVAMMGVWNVLNYWYIRQKEYGYISGYQISQTLFSAGFKVGFGLIPLVGGLVYATILSPLCALIVFILLSAKLIAPLLSEWDWQNCKKSAKKYSNFPKYSTPRVVLNNIAGQLPVLVLTPLFGNKLVGFWGMAIMLAFVPISIVTRALYQVLYQQTTEKVNNSLSVRAYYQHFTWWTLAVIIPVFCLLWWVLPELAAWLLGDEWRTVGIYIRWMLPWLTVATLVLSTGFIPDIFGKQKMEFVFEIFMALARAAGVILGIWKNDFLIAIAGYSIGSAIVSGARYVWQLSLIRRYEQSLEQAA